MGKQHTILDLIRATPSFGFCTCRDEFIVHLNRDIIDHEGNGRGNLPDLHFMATLRFGSFRMDLRRRVEEGSLDPATPVSGQTWSLFEDMVASANQQHSMNPLEQLILFLFFSFPCILFWACMGLAFNRGVWDVRTVPGFDFGCLVAALVFLLFIYVFYNLRVLYAWFGEIVWERSRKVRSILRGVKR